MFEPTFQFASISLSTYTTLIATAILTGGGFALYRSPSGSRLRVADVLIGGLLGGVFLARLEHILLNWNYFAYNTSEIIQIHRGGLDWHGAVVGSGLGMIVVSHWRKVDLKQIVDSLTLLIPLLLLAIWWGCWSASCRYGLEVATMADYPAWMVWEGRDIFGIYASRFNTQAVGALMSFILLLMTLVLFIGNWLYLRRFWLLMSLVACMIFFISFLQGDYSIQFNHLRLSQYLNSIFGVFAIYMFFRIRP